MKYNKNNIVIRPAIFLMVFLITLSSCEDFLEEVPTNQLTSQADLTSREYGEPLAIGAYRMLSSWTGGARDWGNILPNTLEFPTGGAFTSEPHAQFDKYATNQVTGNLLDNFNNQWSNWYAGVQDANLALDLLPSVDLSEAILAQYQGEVRALRAFYYFNIVRYWGDAVMITAPLANVNEAEMPRTSLKQIYDEVIIPDLEFALNAVPAGKSNDGRVTQDVVRAILADVYLTVSGYPYQEVETNPAKDWCGEGSWSMQEYPVSGGTAKAFLQKAKVQLDALYGSYALGTYDDLHDPAMNNNGEAIFQVQYSIQPGYNNGILQPSLPLLTKISKSDENGSFVPAKHYYDSYAANDERAMERGMFFTWDTNIDDPTDIIQFSPPHLFKYYDVAAVKSVNGSGLNWSHYRYADILLMLTEVNWALGESATEIEKGINEVRLRAGLAPLSGATLTLKDILSERAWELVFENKMLWDQRRTRRCIVYGDEEISGINNFVGYQPKIFNFAFTPQHLLSPIPGDEMNNNGQIQQNFGYLPTQTK
ncbi:RagB/SusD family nutrient uptake outer membrane protein [Cyclobacterium qasimii]|nr:RagB/SusD family nutrient uptake outer membrane protein [Cyclobacterium qasimii]